MKIPNSKFPARLASQREAGRQIPNCRAGQSLIEILIALAIGAILIGAAALGIAFMLRATSTNQNLQSASGLIRETIEKLRAWSSADWQNVYGLTKGTSTKYFLSASGTVFQVIQGEEGVVENEVRTNLVGRWGLDESTGTIAYDMSGNGVNGTLGGTWTRATGTICAVGGCLVLNGASTNIALGTSTGLNITGNLSIVAWVKTTSTAAQGLVGKGPPSGSSGYLSYIWSSGVADFYSSGGGGHVQSVRTVNDGSWHLIAIVLSGTNLSFYVDGAFDVTRTSAAPLSTTNTGVIGRESDSSGSYFNGLLDDVRVYNRALSAAEIQRLYQSRKFTRYFSIENTCRSATASSTIDTSPCDSGFFEDPSTQKVTAAVNWVTTQTIAELKLTEFLTRWKNEVFRQADWSGGAGQEGPISEPNNRFASSTGVDISSSGLIKIQGL